MDKFRLRPKTEIHTHSEVHAGAWEDGPLAVRIYKPDWGMPAVQSRWLGIKYPTLAKHLAGRRLAKEDELIIGELLIDPKATESKQLAQTGLSIHGVARRIMAETRESLHKLAVEAQVEGSPVSTVDFFVGVSRLSASTANSTSEKPLPSVAEMFGFEVFEIDENPNIPVVPSASEIAAQGVYEQSGIDAEKAKEILKKRTNSIAILSKARLIELYGQPETAVE
ncbi:MAG: hypothetical protein KBD06_02505 [Candidatus Pacebacteria bacterium]|nr:hypothetical protein [Candidatus Paceibacterota bacterium]